MFSYLYGSRIFCGQYVDETLILVQMRVIPKLFNCYQPRKICNKALKSRLVVGSEARSSAIFR